MEKNNNKEFPHGAVIRFGDEFSPELVEPDSKVSISYDNGKTWALVIEGTLDLKLYLKDKKALDNLFTPGKRK